MESKGSVRSCTAASRCDTSSQPRTLMARILNQTITTQIPKPISLRSTITVSSHRGLHLPVSSLHVFPLKFRMHFSLCIFFFIHLIRPPSLVPISSSAVCPPTSSSYVPLSHPHKVMAFTTRVRKPFLIQGKARQYVFLLNAKVFITLGTTYSGLFSFDIPHRHRLTVAANYLRLLIFNDP